MSTRLLLKQTYWLGDSPEQVRQRVERVVALLSRRTCDLELTIARHQKKRTPVANAYLWGVCYVLMADASGYEKEEIHYAMCSKYFGSKVVEVLGERFTRPLRTTTTNEEGEAEWLGAADFAEFVDFVIREAAFWYDCSIPPPTPKEVPRDERNPALQAP